MLCRRTSLWPGTWLPWASWVSAWTLGSNTHAARHMCWMFWLPAQVFWLLSWARLGQHCLWGWARLNLQGEGESFWWWEGLGRAAPGLMLGPPNTSSTWTPPSLPSSPAAQTSAGQDNREHVHSDNSSVLLQLLGLFIKGYVQVKFKKDLALLFIHRCIQEHLELLQAFSSH